MSETTTAPQLSGNISDSGIHRWNALRINGDSEPLGLLIIQHGVFVPIISFAGKKNMAIWPTPWVP
jgi:hypothetical protein